MTIFQLLVLFLWLICAALGLWSHSSVLGWILSCRYWEYAEQQDEMCLVLFWCTDLAWGWVWMLEVKPISGVTASFTTSWRTELALRHPLEVWTAPNSNSTFQVRAHEHNFSITFMNTLYKYLMWLHSVDLPGTTNQWKQRKLITQGSPCV